MTTFPDVPRAAYAPARYDATGSFRTAGQPADASPGVPPVLLLGSDHGELGAVAGGSLGDSVGLALSAGAVEKGAGCLDPNEDAALAASGRAGHLLAVADGHGGADAAEAALAGVTSACPALDDGWSTPELVVLWAVDAARTAVAARLAQVGGARRGSRTTLAVALVTADRVCTASYGDSSVLRVRGRRPQVLTAPAPLLGPRSCAVPVRTTSLHRRDRVVLATAGLVTALGEAFGSLVTAASRGPDPAATTRGLVEQALERGADANLAVVALRR